jgi:large subunit ribosomal protein L25
VADNVDLQAQQRNERGKNAARRLRASGMTPAVLYGEGNEAGGSTALAIPTKIVDYTLHHFGDNALYNIAIDGDTSTARVVDAQRDPVSGLLVHVDFAPVNMTEIIEVTVPLHVTGDAPGVEEGGVLQQVAYEVQVESLPGDIPQEVTLDVSGLGMNENLTLGDLTLPEGVTLLSEPEEVAVTVTAPTEITEEEMEAAGIVEEPTDEEEAAEEAAEIEEAAEGEEASEEDAAEQGTVGQNVQA